MSPKLSAILLLLTAIAFALSPFFYAGFGGFDPNRFPIPQSSPPVQPAGYAFAIWGLIYAWLIAHALFGFLRRSDDADWIAPRKPLFLSLGIGASWIGVAQANPILATLLIWAMLAMALMAFLQTPPQKDRWLHQAPLAIYAGWLTAASCVALGVTGAGYGFLLDANGWAWAMLALALVLGLMVQLGRPQAPEYGALIIWALIAVAVRNFSDGNLAFAAAASAGAAVFLGVIIQARKA